MNKFINIKVELSQNALPVKNKAQTIYALLKMNPVDFPPDQKIPLDLRMVLDRSSSMGAAASQYNSKNSLELLKEACCKAGDMLQPGDRITVYSFSNDSKLELKPLVIKNSKDHQKINKAIQKIRLSGSTHLSTSLEEMLKINPLNNNVLQRALIFTDGEVNIPNVTNQEKKCIKIAGKAKQKGIPFWVYGTGISYAEKFLKKLAAVSGGYFEHISDPADMISLFSDQMSYFKDIAVTNAEITLDAVPGAIIRNVSRVIPDIESYTGFQPTYFSTTLPDIDKTRGAALLIQLELTPVFTGLSEVGFVNLAFDVPSLGLKGVQQNAKIKVLFTEDQSLIRQNQDVIDVVTLQGAHTLATMGAQAAETGNAGKGVTLMQQAADLYTKMGADDMATKLVTLSNTVSTKGSISGSNINTKRTLTTVSRKLVTRRLTTGNISDN